MTFFLNQKVALNKTIFVQVALYDDIYVQSHINAVRYLALAIEQCWLTGSPRVTSHAGPGDLRLVMAGCPVHSGVSMHWDPGSNNAAFSFKVRTFFVLFS